MPDETRSYTGIQAIIWDTETHLSSTTGFENVLTLEQGYTYECIATCDLKPSSGQTGAVRLTAPNENLISVTNSRSGVRQIDFTVDTSAGERVLQIQHCDIIVRWRRIAS